MQERGREIERFYWLLLNLLGKAFGYLMIVGGALAALAFLRDAVSDGSVAFNGRLYTDMQTRVLVVVIPALVAAAGYVLVTVLPYYPPRLREAER